MDYTFDRRNTMHRNRYMSIEGRIASIEPTAFGNRRTDGCMMFINVESMDGSIANFMITPATYVVDFTTLQQGMTATFFYRADLPVPLIYPPQYNAVVVAPQMHGDFVFVGRFNNSLTSDDRSLRLNMKEEVPVLTTNNQTFMGDIANHDLVVIYSNTTRSIPAQTTPMKVVVLCQQERMQM